MANVRKTQQADEVRDAEAQPVNLDSLSQTIDYIGAEYLRFDDQGMVLPHSILGSLEDFRSYLEAKGETELAKRIPKSGGYAPPEPRGRHPSEAVGNGSGIPSGPRNTQSNALQHWRTHMTQRRRQQDFLADLLATPVENLLMNQASRFRETQEQRDILNQSMPLIHSGNGNRVGSTFWSLPQRYGDDMSGITATLTATEQGRWKPVTHIGQPSSIRQESGIICAETQRPASRTWNQSSYRQHQYQKLAEDLGDIPIQQPDISGLEVIGSGKPFTLVTVCCRPLVEKEEEEHKKMKENPDPLAQEDIQSDARLIPALRFCGQLASWTGNSTTKQGEVGISARIFFKALTGDIASSQLELHNEGITVIFYSWQQIPLQSNFPNLRMQSRTKSQHFYFNSSSGVIKPGDTQQVEFMFKSKEHGIKTQLWQLNTHPVLLQGASMQVTLRGVALYRDKTADQRLFIETKLEEQVKVKMCRSIVDEVLSGIHTPDRPSSPAELYITQEQEFLAQNPKLQYHHQPVEDLKSLWHAHVDHAWDLSVNTLQQVVLSLPEEESQETSLAQLNSLLMQLSEPPQLQHHQLTAATIGRQLWGKMLDTMADEAMRLSNLLGLPERDTWIDKKEESPNSDADTADQTDEKSEKTGGAAAEEERNGARSRSATKKAVAVCREKDIGEKGQRSKGGRKKPGKKSPLLSDAPPDDTSQQPPDDHHVKPEVMDFYTRLLSKKVKALMEDLVDNLCDLMDELDGGDEHDLQY